MLGVSQTMDMVNTQMSKHGKLVNLLMKLHFIQDSQRNVQEIRLQIEHYEKRNLELVSKWPNGMPEWARNEKYDIDTKISEVKWTIYDD
jgi:hypothetical protein